LADIIAVAADLLTDIGDLGRVEFAMKGGGVYKAGGKEMTVTTAGSK